MTLLSDVTVIELGQIIAGPLAGSQLGDLGAQVVKVEPPGGEPARTIDPRMGGISSYFAGVNRNKDYVAIDLKTDEGRSAFRRLAAEADVIVENFRPDTMDRLGLGPDVLRAANEELIYCAINGYRCGSTYEDLPAFDGVVQALGGTMHITGTESGPPVRCGVPVADIAAAMYAVQSIMAALYRRSHDAGGCHIEIPLLDAVVSLLTVRAGHSFATGEPYPRRNTHSSIAPWTVFETADGYLSVSVTSERLWTSFCRAIDRTDLIDDPRFESNRKRVDHAEALYDILRPLFRERSAREWFDRMKREGAPAAPVYDTIEMWDDPYIDEMGLAKTVPDPSKARSGTGDPGNDSRDGPHADGVTLLQSPIVLDSDRLPIRTAPRPPGDDTESVLRAVGYSEAEIEALRADGVVE